MSYKRSQDSTTLNAEIDISSALAGIGFNFATAPETNANIEDSLYSASIEGMQNDQLRTLSLLSLWLELHWQWINADRLYRLISICPNARVKAFWVTILKGFKDRRFAKFEKLSAEQSMELLRVGNAYHILKHGLDERFSHGPLLVPKNILRRRTSDILTPKQLAKTHRGYYWRLITGPSYRADMLAELEKSPKISAAHLAKKTYGSYATAWRVKKEVSIAKDA